jgi:hypothetical protein
MNHYAAAIPFIYQFYAEQFLKKSGWYPDQHYTVTVDGARSNFAFTDQSAWLAFSAEYSNRIVA